MTEPVDYAVFYEQLAELVASRETATLYFKGDTNHVAIIGVRAGKVVSLICGPRRGGPAVRMIRQARTGTLRRDHDELSFHEHELPSTTEIMDLLRPVQEVPAPAKHVREDSDVPVPTGTAGQIQILCRLLTEYVGPVAPLLCEEKILSCGGHSGPRETDEIVQDLAQEIESPWEAHEFVRRAQQALRAAETAKHSHVRAAEPGVASIIDVAALKGRLCDLLTTYLGPVAPLVCEQHFSKLAAGTTKAQAQDLIRRVAAEIGADGEIDKFITEATRELAAVAD